MNSTYPKASTAEIAKKIISSGAFEVRQVDQGEEPFVYSTGNRGPGYVMIKGLVGQPEILKFLTKQLAYKVIEQAEFDFIDGNVTGGVVPGWQLRNDVSEILDQEIPFCYLRGARKQGGHGELITGDRNNPFIKKGMRALIVEELVNYAGTTSNAVDVFREAGYKVSHAACILSYDHQESLAKLKEKKVTLIALITLPELLELAESEKLLPLAALRSYREFLACPFKWQIEHGYIIPTDSAEQAKKNGYKMLQLSRDQALAQGAPLGKLDEGVIYWAAQNKAA